MRSIPAVFGLRGGRVLDSFLGALPEPAVRAWINGLLPTPAEKLLAEARAGDDRPLPPRQKCRASLVLAPDDPTIQLVLARLLLGLGRTDEAQELIRRLEARGFLEPEAEKLKAELTLLAHSRETGGVDHAAARPPLTPTTRNGPSDWPRPSPGRASTRKPSTCASAWSPGTATAWASPPEKRCCRSFSSSPPTPRSSPIRGAGWRNSCIDRRRPRPDQATRQPDGGRR